MQNLPGHYSKQKQLCFQIVTHSSDSNPQEFSGVSDNALILRKRHRVLVMNHNYQTDNVTHAAHILVLVHIHEKGQTWQIQRIVTNSSLLFYRGRVVVVEHSPGMREVGGSIPGRVKQKTLKFEALLSAQHKKS